MGDYTKVIVNCGVKKREGEELESFKKEFLDNVYLCSSAYHCGGEVFHIDNDWHHRTDITFVTQLKYSRGLEEFIDWLRPHVTQGFGESNDEGGEMFAMSITEYQQSPTVYWTKQ